MPGTDTEYVTFSDWRTNSSFNDLDHIGSNPQAYRSLNMQVYQNGTLGTRPWVRSWDMQTGLTLADTIDAKTSVQWRASRSVLPSGELWVHPLANDVAFYDFETSTWAYHTGLDVFVTDVCNYAAEWGGDHDWDNNGASIGAAQSVLLPTDYWIFAGEGYVNGSETAATIDWAQTASTIDNFTLYRNRVYGWQGSSSSTSNQLYYTDSGSYIVGAAANFINIGGGGSSNFYIIGAWPIKDSLLIAMSDDKWWALTGEPDTGTIRYVGEYVVPSHGAAASVLNDAVYFPGPEGRQVCIATSQGVDTRSLFTVRPWSGSHWTNHHDYRTLTSPQEQAIAMHYVRLNTDNFWFSLENVNGTWGFHSTGTIGASAGERNMGLLRDVALVNSGRAYAYLSEETANGTEVQVSTRDIILNRPSKSTDVWSDSAETGADDTAHSEFGDVQLAKFRPGSGQEVRIKSVTIDFDYWNDASTVWPTPNMVVTVDGNTSVPTFANAVLPGLGTTNTTSNAPSADRYVARFDSTTFKPFISARIDQIQSIALHVVTVEYEVRPMTQFRGQTAGT